MQANNEDFFALPQAKRPVALLDVDHTLVYTDRNSQDIMNESLLQALKSSGISDVYLFTDMIFQPESIRERLQVIQFLNSMGFTVHGCITPIDFFWDLEPTALQSFEEELANCNISLRAGAEKNTQKLPELFSKYPLLKDRAEGNHYPAIGKAFQQASLPVNLSDPTNSQKIKLHSNTCKSAMDITTYLRKLESCKAIMFKQFLAHRPDWVSVCYVFDDRIENINAVKNCDGADLKVYAIHGEFTQKGDTFTQNYIPVLDENTLTIQIKNIVNTALKNTILNHESKILSAVMPTTPLDKATSVVKKITDDNLSFNEQSQMILEHFSKIPLKFFGGFQLSFFDVELLRLLVINKVIFMKLDLLNKTALALTRWDISRPSDCQQLIAMMHQNNAAARKSSSAHNLHASADQMPRLPRLKTSEAISIEAFRRSANSGGILRPRSFSEGPKPSDTPSTNNEAKAIGLEKN